MSTASPHFPVPSEHYPSRSPRLAPAEKAEVAASTPPSAVTVAIPLVDLDATTGTTKLYAGSLCSTGTPEKGPVGSMIFPFLCRPLHRHRQLLPVPEPGPGPAGEADHSGRRPLENRGRSPAVQAGHRAGQRPGHHVDLLGTAGPRSACSPTSSSPSPQPGSAPATAVPASSS